MRIGILAGVAMCLLTASCSSVDKDSGSQSHDTEAYDTDTSAPTTTQQQPKAGSSESTALAINLPKLAYSYRLSFRVPGDRLARVQQAHLELCDKLGQARCQLISLGRGNVEDRATTAEMKLRVASNDARSFQNALGKAIDQAGGRATETSVEAEDVSKAMVDAQARIDQRALLVERLTTILRTRQGKVSELVEAERSVAKAQEELDQAKAWLAELRGRVAMSTFTLRYAAIAPHGGASSERVRDALTTSVSNFVFGLHQIIIALIYLAPWLALLGLLIFGLRWLRKRFAAPTPPQG